MYKNFTKNKPIFSGANFINLGRFLLLILVVAFASTFSATAQIKITGKISDRAGAIPGVTIKVKGTAITASSDSEGKYSITVPNAQSILQFTYISFVPKEETVGTRTVINVTLVESIDELDAVVVTGYGGTSKKRDLASSTSTITSKEIAERQPLNLFDALQGQAAGVLIVNDNGEPGAEGSITIRGASTFSSEGQGTNPLYVIDGVITPNAAALNPNDIENIEVLKDAASASIYGSRAANGVILITTKRGLEAKPRIDVQYVYTMGKIAHEIQQSNPVDIRYYRQLIGQVNVLTDSVNPGLNSANDLQDLLLGNLAQKHDMRVSISGGSKRAYLCHKFKLSRR